jgi:hypothetical protein
MDKAVQMCPLETRRLRLESLKFMLELLWKMRDERRKKLLTRRQEG